jgi:ligand-binding SRPBCC domain-containing protein
MPTIVVVTQIVAPIEACFDAARSLDAHVRTAADTDERIVSTHNTDLLKLHDVVTFEARHLGLRQRLTAQVVEFTYPTRFVDEMRRGPFSRLRHVHQFHTEGPQTIMTDTLSWTSPGGPFGRLADAWLVRPHLTRFLRRKQTALKHLIETTSVRTAPVTERGPAR